MIAIQYLTFVVQAMFSYMCPTVVIERPSRDIRCSLGYLESIVGGLEVGHKLVVSSLCSSHNLIVDWL